MRAEDYTIKVERSYQPSNHETFMDSDGGFWAFLNKGWVAYNEGLDTEWFNSPLQWDEIFETFGPIYKAR